MVFMGAIYPLATIDEDLSAERLTNYFSRWTPHWYNIHRTEVLQECWDKVAELNIRNIFLMEHTLCAIMAIRGKIFTGQYPYYFRQVEGGHVTSSQEAKERDGDWLDQVLSETWSADYMSFVRTISTELKKSDGISEVDSIRIVHTAYRNFFGPTLVSVFPARRNAIETQVINIYRYIERILSASKKIFYPSEQRINMKKLEACECTVRIKGFLASKK
jgi:hypothetical protein